MCKHSNNTRRLISGRQASCRRGALASRDPVDGGFTLIELLSVIVIVSVLFAILIPSIGRVLASARDSKSQSNLREWHRVAMLYANDNQNRLPLGYDRTSSPPAHWPVPLGKYLGYNFRGPNLGRNDTIGTSPNHEPDHRYGPNYISYGINVEVAGAYFSTTKDPVTANTLFRIDPQSILFGDSSDSWHLYPELNFRNRGKAFAVLVDGAVVVFESDD